MAETGYQYDDCDHSEATQNIFKIAFAHVLFYKITDVELEINSGN